MDENLAGFYWEKLHTPSEKPHVVLSKFYSELLEQPLDKNLFIMFGRLLKVYSREDLFFAIVSIYHMEKVDLKKVYGLIVYFCNERFQKRNPESPTVFDRIDTKAIAKRIEKLSRQQKDFPEPFEESEES